MATVTYTDRITTNNERIIIDVVGEYSGSTLHIDDFPNPNDIPNVQTVNEIAQSVLANRLPISLPAGSPFPKNILASDLPGFANGIQRYSATMVMTATKDRFIFDITIDQIFTDSSKTVLQSIDIYGHNSGDDATTADNVTIIIFT